MHPSKPEFNPSAQASSRLLIFFVLAAFFVSGGCGLVYEILWSRFLANLIGATSISHVVVLSTFMGGLAIGAFLLGRFADKVTNGLKLYGWLEIGIGLFGCFFFLLYRLAEKGFLVLASGLSPGSSSLLALKFSISILLIITPAIGMGATLPAMTRYLTGYRPTLRRNIALLYGLNSLGAVFGSLIGGFYLLYSLGLSAAMSVTGLINVLLGVASLLMAKYSPYQPAADRSQLHEVPEQHKRARFTSLQTRLALWAAGLSGLATMGLQVAWIRYFGLVLGSTHSSFTIVVAAFITGISLGSFFISTRFAKSSTLPSILAFAFILTTTTLVLSLFLYGRFPFHISLSLAIINRTPLGWQPYQFLRFFICFVFMLIPTVAAGMIFPVCVRIFSQSRERLGQDTGLIYTVNTIGALLGILLASQVLYRLMSFPRTLQAILLLFLAGSLLASFGLPIRKRLAAFLAVAILAVLHLTFWQPWTPLHLLTDRIDFKELPTFASYRELLDQREVIFETQDPDVHAMVTVAGDETSGARTLFVNGKADASDNITGDMITQVLSAHIPMLLHPEPQKVFVLGLGSGVTSGEVLKFPQTEKVTTVELASSVFDASKEFAHVNSRFWEHPKHSMVIDDAKTFLQLTQQKFDVMIMEPTNVWQNGMAGLFSRNFFQLVQSRLAPGGIVCQWLHAYGIDNLTLESVLTTFAQVFPGTRIFQLDPTNYIIIAVEESWQFKPQHLSNRMQKPAVKQSLAAIGIHTPVDLLLGEILSQDAFQKTVVSGTAPVNTDNRPVLEKLAEYGHFLAETADYLKQQDSRLDPDADLDSLLLHPYMEKMGFDFRKLLASMNPDRPSLNEPLRLQNSIAMRAVQEFQLANPGSQFPPDLLIALSDPTVREIISHPLYGKAPEQLTASEAYLLLTGEMALWQRSSSSFWSPATERLADLFKWHVRHQDIKTAVNLALNMGFDLAAVNACSPALFFLRKADNAGISLPKSIARQKDQHSRRCRNKLNLPTAPGIP